ISNTNVCNFNGYDDKIYYSEYSFQKKYIYILDINTKKITKFERDKQMLKNIHISPLYIFLCDSDNIIKIYDRENYSYVGTYENIFAGNIDKICISPDQIICLYDDSLLHIYDRY